METYKLRTDEQETILIFNRADNVWEASTSISAHMAKLERAGWEIVGDSGYEKAYRAPKNAVTFRNPNKGKRSYTEEQKAAMAERLRETRSKTK